MRFAVLLLFVLMCSIGCTRKVNSLSNMRIMTGTGTLAVGNFPVNQKICYGVSVSGLGIAGTPATTCSPAVGIVAGFVGDGDILQVQADKGSNRTIDVYAFLENAGANDPCPTMTGTFSSSQLLQTYLVGTVPNITLDQDAQTVTVPITFPGVSANLAATNSYPTSCTASAANQNLGFEVASAKQLSTGTNIQMTARVGMTRDQKVLSGTNIKLIVK